MSIDDYIGAQRANLDQVRRLPHFDILVTGAHRLYDTTIDLMPPSGLYGPSLLLCHRALLAASTLIGQAQPDDAAPITRRAIEAVLVCLAHKFDRSSFDKWLDVQRRYERWQKRLAGEEPKGPLPGVGWALPAEHPASPIRAELNRWKAMLSEADVHHSPAHLVGERWTVVEDAEGRRRHFSYFERDQALLERTLGMTTAVHAKMLEAFDMCFEGALSAHEEWRGAMDAFVVEARRLVPGESGHQAGGGGA